MNTSDRTQLAQEEARRLAIEREIARQQNQRQQPVNAQRYNVEDGTYNVTSGGQSVGAGQSVTTSGIAPGQSVEYLEGAGTVDAMPRVRPRPGARPRVLSGTAEPKAAILLNRAVLRGITSGDGLPGYFIPPTQPTIAQIYAMNRTSSPFGIGSTIRTVPPTPDFQSLAVRYRKISAPYPRCEVGFSPWDDPPYQITADYFKLYVEPRHTFRGDGSGQEVICFTAAQGTPLPPFPRFFPKYEGVCQWDSEFAFEWAFVEQYQVAPGNPGGAWVPGTPLTISQDFTRVYLLLGSDGSLTEVFRLSDQFRAIVIMAIDEQGTVHITFKWKAEPRSPSPVVTLRHFQVTNGAVVSVPQNTSWKADYANRSRNDIPLPPSADACINEYQDNGNINIIGSKLYELSRPTWSDLLNPGGITLNLLERAISSDGATCAIGATTSTEFTISTPVAQLTGGAGGFYEGGEVAAYVGGLSQ